MKGISHSEGLLAVGTFLVDQVVRDSVNTDVIDYSCLFEYIYLFFPLIKFSKRECTKLVHPLFVFTTVTSGLSQP